MRSRGREWRIGVLLAASATVLTLAVLAGIGEVAVRHRERTRTTVPGTMSRIFYRHGRLGQAMERGTTYYRWVHIGRQGFRGARDVSVARPDSVFRIIAVGGSTTFDGNTSGDTSAWPARLEQILDSIAAPTRFEVLNAGVPGYVVMDDLLRLELELHRFDPDLIILYQGHNDLYNALARAGRASDPGFNARPGEIPTVYPWQRWLERHSLLYNKLRSRWEAIQFRSTGKTLGSNASPKDYHGAVESGSDAFAHSIRLYLTVAHSLGIRVMIPQVVYASASAAGAHPDSTLQALWGLAIPYAPPAVVWNGYARYDSLARMVASKTDAVYVPASDPELWLLDGYTGGDPIHFNDEGAWRLARHLAAAIRELPEVERAAEWAQ